MANNSSNMTGLSFMVMYREPSLHMSHYQELPLHKSMHSSMLTIRQKSDKKVSNWHTDIS